MGPPAATVTFVFTDPEGSTALFTQLGDEDPVLLRRHDEMLAREGGRARIRRDDRDLYAPHRSQAAAPAATASGSAAATAGG